MTPGPGPAASIIIPHHEDPVRLRRCLAALAPQLRGRAAEVIVVDNASACDLTALMAAFPDVRFLREPIPGAAAARNRGVRDSRGARLFFLDADCDPAPDWLATAFAVIGAQDIVGGTVTLFDETAGPRSGAQAFEHVFGFRQARYVRQGFSVTANLLTWRWIFDDVGPFASGVAEDRDWCRRAVARGYRVTHEPALRVAHPSRATWGALRGKWRRLTRESYALQRGGRTLWAMRSLVVLLSPAGHLHRVLFDQSLALAERMRGAVTLIRLRALRARWMILQVAGGDIADDG